MVRQDRTPRRRLDPDSRREAILAAAAAAFADRPFADVTIASIAADAQASSSLVYRYFAGKEELYAQVVGMAIEDLLDKQAAALDALDEGVPVRDRIGAATLVYLDHVASHPDAWAAPLRGSRGEPQAAAELRVRVRADYVERLARLLAPSEQARHEYALWGYYGFVDAACLRWVDKGCPPAERWALVEAALGCLGGALGDWAA